MTIKNIILQHFDNHNLRELDKLSIDNIKDYAKRIGSNYELVIGYPFRKHLTAPCQKLFMLNEKYDDYDNVLMLDIDMFTPKNMNENVFNENGIGLYSNTQKQLHRKIVMRYPNISSKEYPYWGGAIYKVSLEARKTLRSGLGSNEDWMENYNKRYNFGDEGIMHTLAVKTKYNPNHPYLDNKWCQCSFLPNPQHAGFIHIRTKIKPEGPKREKIENYWGLVNDGII